MRVTPLLLAALLAIPGPAAAEEPAPPPPPPPEVHRFTLDNGLRVALKPLRGAPSVAVVLLFGFGEDADPPGRSGLAHFCEHLWCTAATATAPARTADSLAAAYPLGWNAQTGRDYTVLATVVQPEALPSELDAVADRLDSLAPTAADLSRERPRVLDELENMYGRIPALAAMNWLLREGPPWPGTPRRGGSRERVEALTLEETRAFAAAHYRAGNARLVVAGNFDPEEAEKRIREGFAELPRGTAPERHGPGRTRIYLGSPDSGGPLVKVRESMLTIIKTEDPLVPGSRICLGWEGPLPTEEGYAAFTVLAARLKFRSAQALKPGEAGPRGMLLPLDLPGPAFFAGPLLEGEKPEAAAERLRKAAAAILDLPIADGQYNSLMLGSPLGTWAVPDAVAAQNTYGVAFGIGRRDQLGIDGRALAKEMAALTTEDLAKARARWFADGPAVVVIANSR